MAKELNLLNKLGIVFLSSFLFSACSKQNPNAVQVTGFIPTKPQCEESAVPKTFVVKWKDGSVSIQQGLNRDDFLKQVYEPNKEKILLAEQDQVIQLSKPIVSVSGNETYGLGASGTTADTWGQSVVQVDGAWSKGFRGQGITVAVIDSGVDRSHPQLESQIYINPNEIPDNGIDDDNNGYIDDVSGWDFYDNRPFVDDTSGHGTHVAGIIAADHIHGAIRGLAPEAKILPLDFMSTNGQGQLSDAILAIQYAVKQGARVINASWGGAPCSLALNQTIASLESQGVIFVAAAGNSGFDLDQDPEYPAAFSNTNQITVGASTTRDYIAAFSNYSFRLVHLFAPGVEIFSTYPGNRTAALSGTSMAAPFVSGAVALMLSKAPDATPAQVRSALFRSVDVGDFAAVTKGRLNIEKAMNSL